MRGNEKWYKLDNAGKMYPSITTTEMSTVFRLSFILKEIIDRERLQMALDKVIERFPYFRVNMHRGMFWYYFDYTEQKLMIEQEEYFPCMFLKYKKKNFPFRVVYYENRLAVEFSHSITDGTGALVFLKTLLCEYVEPDITKREVIEMVKNIGEAEVHGEWENSFEKFYKKGAPFPDKNKRALQLNLKRVPKGEYYAIKGILESEDIKKCSERYKCTITQFLLALYFEALIEYFKNGKKRKGRIVINTLVNLRRIFPSDTMKNFFGSIAPEIDTRLGEYTREEIIGYIKNYMKLMINEKNFLKAISRNVSSEKNIFVRLMPLLLKNLFMPVLYNVVGEAGYTTSFSSMGDIKFPNDVIDKIDHAEFFPPPSYGNIIRTGIIASNGKTTIIFGKLTKNTTLEMLFFRKIRKENIRVKIETNIQ